MPRVRSIPHRRLVCQLIARPAASPAEAVAWLGAVQAQDYLASLWAVGLRTRGAAVSAVEQAVADGSIVRLHAFRGTWQYIARDDVRWMLALVARRGIGGASRLHQLGLDERTLRRAGDALREATRGGAQLTRAEIAAALRRARIDPGGQRLSHILAHAELDAVVCSGARRGKQTTFASFDERVPAAPAVPRDAAIAELARRFVRGRGPATLSDFVWWSGLRVADARAGFAAIAGEAVSELRGDVPCLSFRDRAAPAAAACLLPAFDEYLVGYRHRHDVLDDGDARAINVGGGMIAACVVVDGAIAGTWRRTLTRAGVEVELQPLRRWDRRARAAISGAAERYAAFLGSPLARLTTTPA